MTLDVKLALELWAKKAKQECFDWSNLSSRPTAEQQRFLGDIGTYPTRAVRGGNQSGKSATVAREVSWLFNDEHPTWNKPKAWKDAPLQIIILGRSQKIIEESLWLKLRGFLLADSYAESRQGGALQKVTHKENGNTIIFISHENANQARERVQSFTANYVWLDELPGDVKLIEEIERRVQAKRGYVVLSFTPKTPNLDIQRRVDALEAPHGQSYFFSMLDNPVYSEEDKERILASLATFSEGYRRTILYGDWFNGEKLVYSLDTGVCTVESLPSHYSYSWNHVEVVDPAISSKFGWSLYAQDPGDGTWYVVRSAYFMDLGAPDNWVDECLKNTRGYNIVRRISDPHESWFIYAASAKGVNYMTPFSKKDRKVEMIAAAQQFLASGALKIVSSTNRELLSEISTMEWSDSANDKIVKESTFHIENTLRYFVDGRPRDLIHKPQLDWNAQLRVDNQERKKAEATKAKLGASSRKRWQVRRTRGRI